MFGASKALLVAFTAVAPALASIDNSKDYDELTARAVNVQDGSYTLTNVGTGQTINYLSENHQVFPDDGNSTGLAFAGTGDGPFTKLKVDGLCMSSLWDEDAVATGVGADAATVLHSCDPSSAKQDWLLVPATVHSNTLHARRLRRRQAQQCSAPGDDDEPEEEYTTYYNTACCPKPRDWVMRHPQYVKGPKYHHMNCASLLSSQQRRDFNFTQDDWDLLAEQKAQCQASLPAGHPAKISKRELPTAGTYYIVTLDHLDDMPTRAVSGCVYEKQGDDHWSTTLDVFAEGTPDQQWIINSV